MTFHHWSLTEWFPLCSTTRKLFTHWDSCNTLDSICPHWWFPHLCWTVFIIGCYSEGLFHALFTSGACERHTSWWSFQYFIRVLPNIWPSCYSSCWMMGDALIPSFQQISSYQLQHIFLWDKDLESLLVPWGLQSSVEGSLTIDSGNTSMSLDR
jgi:hypothetical protein